ncbi:prepilin peptidase [Metallumcola ferriviriculae]|uniref:Prepilin peptidase n=1 Tax=Metallumcola ferriviriculae TaxID=3039180 RepID=A0AAU0USB3_9FIRM|nr:prepilin peptidase [Desulfitibacteraceae bacterium MK1]
MTQIIVFLFGLVIGSFLNVVIYRLPLKQSIIFPASHCPNCGVHLLIRDLVPVLSWLFLQGRCRNCGTRISRRYPLIELFTALVFLILSLYFQGWQLIGLLFLAAILIAASAIDFKHGIIPNQLIIAGLVVGLADIFLNVSLTWQQQLLGFFTGGGLLLLLAVVSRGGMGGGDIKLTAVMGIFLGPKLVLVTLVLASALGAAAGVALILAGKKGRKDAIVFGPFLAVGALLALLWGETLLGWYFSTW